MSRRRRCNKKLLGILLCIIGAIIIGVILLPFAAWMVIFGCIFIFIGYKLFC
ncbi:MAG: hypothetical protein ACOYVK_04035 [Bacillota bacterium]